MNTKELRIVLLNRTRDLLAKESEIRQAACEAIPNHSIADIDGLGSFDLLSGWCSYLLSFKTHEELYAAKMELHDRHGALGWANTFPVKYGENTESVNGDMYFSANAKEMWGEGKYADQRWEQLARLEAHLSKITEA
ncbi:hypothetical protein ACRXCV_00160 (plasmid) [Halobacteriovorax sp. GFR7]|uniref:hypothetical protein n=1 Tax=unclassified Halobacteriovorax TaxID=2639665 RepID=UPI003D962139